MQVRSSAFPAAPEEASSSAQIEEVSQEELAAAKVKRSCTAHRHFPIHAQRPALSHLPFHRNHLLTCRRLTLAQNGSARMSAAVRGQSLARQKL